MTRQIDEKELKVYLQKLLGYEANLTVRKFENGQSNPTFRLNYGERDLVLRKKPGGKLLPGAHQVGREYRVLHALHSANFSVPSVICHCTDTSVIGTEFYIMEFMEGTVYMNRLPGENPRDIREAVLAAVETLAQLHSISAEKVGLSDFGKWTGFCTRQVRTWSRQFEAAKHKTIPEVDELMAWLRNNIPPDVPHPTIVHGDFSLGNIMFHNDQNRVKCVLDWELSTLGHPLTDLAYFCVPYHLPEQFGHFFSGSLSEFIKEEEVVAHYCKLRGIPFPLADWNFFRALACFKLASIVQGVYARFLLGNASSTRAEMYGGLVQPLAVAGLKVAKSSETMMMSNPTVTLSPSPKGREVLEKVKAFLKEYIVPNEKAYYEYILAQDDKWCIVPAMEEWKAKAKAQGLWNLFLPDISGLSNVDYAHIAEQLGRIPFSSECFNCSAPDTGNMEVLHKYGDEYQKRMWLQPLLDGKIRSAFCMTEPAVASSDATNMELSITPDGDSYVVHGRKWWSSGAGDPRCKFGIVMGRTPRPGRGRHEVHSMIVVPFDTPGVKILRPLQVFGYEESPHGHMEVDFNQVRVPRRNLILGEGRGFEIAQGRLGPGRIHHCMRSIGMAERCLELYTRRGLERKTFGKRLIEHQVNQHKLAKLRIEVEQARLLVLNAALMIDLYGPKGARKEIAMIKVAAIKVFKKAVDKTIQIHGGAGVSQDFPFAAWYAGARSLQIADGPDEVHLSAIAKLEIRDQMKKAKL